MHFNPCSPRTYVATAHKTNESSWIVPRKIDITCCDYDEKIIGESEALVLVPPLAETSIAKDWGLKVATLFW